LYCVARLGNRPPKALATTGCAHNPNGSEWNHRRLAALPIRGGAAPLFSSKSQLYIQEKLAMKLKALAAAALLAIGAPSFAAINTYNDAELVLIVWDSTGSYAKDLGITLDQAVANSSNVAGYSFSFNLADAAWTTFLGADGTLAADTKWQLIASDVDGGYGVQELRQLSTLSPTFAPASDLVGEWTSSMQAVGGDKLLAINATAGTHGGGADYHINGSSYSAVGTPGYWPMSDTLGFLNWNMGMQLNETSNLVLAQRYDEFEDFVPTTLVRLGNGPLPANLGVASFSGSTLSYTVAAVPEPGSIAMLMAGLGALGFVARRRRQG
jgi:hypothetical protein